MSALIPLMSPELSTLQATLNAEQIAMLHKVGRLSTEQRNETFSKQKPIKVTYRGQRVAFPAGCRKGELKALARVLAQAPLPPAVSIASLPAKKSNVNWIRAAIGVTALVASVALATLFGLPALIVTAANQAWAYTGTILAAALRNHPVSGTT